MGEVFAADDLEAGNQVALKTIRFGSRDKADLLLRFKREFRALADLHHPNLVQLYDLFSDGDRWYYTMELVHGVPWLHYVRPEGVLDDGRLRRALTQLAGAIEFIHRAGKLHLDLKDSNVLVTAQGAVRVIDFGLVSEHVGSDITETLTMLGTPAYMAPEQCLGMASPASDWYSVGVMLYEALTGELPFTGNPFKVYYLKNEEDAPSPSLQSPEAPADLSHLCSELLSRDPERRPKAPTTLRRLGSVEPTVSIAVRHQPKLSDGSFVGRELELHALQSARRRARSDAVLVRVVGPSGIGKTALIQRFMESVERDQSDTVVLAGRCYERESVPYKAIDSVIDRLTTYLKRLAPAHAAALLPRGIHALVRIFPVLGQVDAVAQAPRVGSVQDERERRGRAFAALRELLARIADRAPLVVHIDDMQWADADSFELLGQLLFTPDKGPGLFLFSDRGEETDVSPAFDQFLRTASKHMSVEELRLAELSLEESTELARRLLRVRTGSAGDVVQGIATEAAGIPFFVEQLAHLLRSRALRRPAGPVREGVGDQTVPAIADVVRSQVTRLPPAGPLVLELVALAGQPVSVEQLRLAVGSGAYYENAILALSAAKLVRTRVRRNRTECEPFHERIRQAILAALPFERARDLHGALAMAFEATGAEPEAIAYHFEAAGEFHRAARYSDMAGEYADASLAFERAARLYGSALRISRPEDPHCQELRIKMADALANAGHGPEAAQEYLLAAKAASANDALYLRQRAADQLLRSGYLDEGLKQLGIVSRAIGLRLSSERLLFAGILCRRMQLRLRGLRYRERREAEIDRQDLLRVDVCWSLANGWSAVDTLRGAEAQALHLLSALRCGEPRRVGLGLAAEAGFALVRERRRSVRRADHLLRLASEIADRFDAPRVSGLVTFVRGLRSWVMGDYKRTKELCHEAAEIYRTRCPATAWELVTAQVFSVASLAWMGELKEMAERLPRLESEAEGRGDRYALASLRLLTRSWLVDLARDDASTAAERIAGAIDQWPPSRGYHLQHYWALLGRFETNLYAGRVRAATEWVQREWGALSQSLLLTNRAGKIFAAQLGARSLLAAASLQSPGCAQRERLLRRAGREIRKVRGIDMLCASPVADLLAARQALLGNQSANAGALYRSAAEGFRDANMGLYAAVSRRRLGEIVGGESGQKLTNAADTWMLAQGITNPERMSAMLDLPESVEAETPSRLTPPQYDTKAMSASVG